MKIAVQISGQVRSLKQSYQTLKSCILDRYDCDIFFSSETTEDTSTLQWAVDLLQPKDYSIIHKTQENLKLLGIQKLIDNYVNVTTHGPNGTYLYVKQHNVICGMFHRWNCNELRRLCDTKYDVVINTRTDLVYGEPLLEKYVEAAKEYLLIPQGFDWDHGLNDIFSIGSPENMDIVCGEFKDYQMYMQDGVTTHPENLFRHHIMFYCLPLRRFSYTLYLRNMQVS